MQEKETVFEQITTFASNVIGSWWMIGAQTLVIAGWITLNLMPNSPTGKFDNERFDTLRLLLAFQSLYITPLILMAQRKSRRADRKVLHEIADDEREAMVIRHEAQERRIRLEEKVDKLLAKLGE